MAVNNAVLNKESSLLLHEEKRGSYHKSISIKGAKN